jgi:DNA primase
VDDLRARLEALDITEWLEAQGLDYRRSRGSSGEQLNVKECPSCGNSKWKTYLNADSGLGNCFVCDTKYNKWKFITAVMGGAPTSKVIASIDEFVGGRAWRPKRTRIAEVNETTVELPESYVLPHRGRNMAYLDDRGVDSSLAEFFHLRFCNVGYYRYKIRGDWHFMPFDGRIIIPVFDLDGNLVTFQGRDVTGTAERKYLFPPGIAAAGTQLYNAHNVVYGTESVVVGEGAFDVIAIKKAFDADSSLKDVIPIGTFGKHLSWGGEETQQAKFHKLRERGVRTVTIMWDGEIAATKAACDAAKKLIVLGFDARIAMLPKDKDPNEVSADVVRAAYRQSVPYSQMNELKLLMKLQSAAV